MTMIDIWLAITLTISLAANGVMWWYLRKLLNKFLFISQNLGDLVEVTENYHQHLKHVNNMDTYNGDETIEYLLRHTQSLMEIMEDYRDVYDISIPLEDEQETQENAEKIPDYSNRQAESETQETPPLEISEENVFYAGARRRNS